MPTCFVTLLIGPGVPKFRPPPERIHRRAARHGAPKLRGPKMQRLPLMCDRRNHGGCPPSPAAEISKPLTNAGTSITATSVSARSPSALASRSMKTHGDGRAASIRAHTHANAQMVRLPPSTMPEWGSDITTGTLTGLCGNFRTSAFELVWAATHSASAVPSASATLIILMIFPRHRGKSTSAVHDRSRVVQSSLRSASGIGPSAGLARGLAAAAGRDKGALDRLLKVIRLAVSWRRSLAR
jgi:hypothetical protein